MESVSVRDIIRSWILTENDIILTIDRSYNKKEALINIQAINSENEISLT